MNPRSNRRRPALAFAGVALATVAAAVASGSPARAGGLCHRRVLLVPESQTQTTREVVQTETVREVVREVEPVATRTVIVREVVREAADPAPTPAPKAAAPTPQAPPAPKAAARDAAEDDRPVVVRERYIIREVAPTAVREVPVTVRTVRTVPVERVVVREVQAAPTYLLVKPKHHLFGGH